MMYGRAAMVSDRSPPPSCMSKMLPALTLGPVADLTMCWVPGRLQSRVSIVHNTSRRPCRLKMRSTIRLVAPYGGRTQLLRGPCASCH
jgi:hypothetical protein